ncbi:MAG: hypothetical protein ISS47_02550 [Candidatus Omnitrophica bacterium]|nr:hypothetical protein [Candidatus Omnitrophota bacterium]
MDKETAYKLIQQKQTEGSIIQEFKQTLSERVARYLQVKPHGIIPSMKFAAASSECSLLFRDGHFYGCIALSQAVAEALVKYLCEKNSWSPESSYENNVDKLFERGFISGQLKEKFFKIWQKRDDYHHLNRTIETDREKLKEIAKEKAKLIAEIEREVFDFILSVDGKLIPKKPKYWEGCDNQVFLRLNP